MEEMIDYVYLAGDLGVKDVSFTMIEYFDEASYDRVALSHVQINELPQIVVEVQRQPAKRGVKVTGLLADPLNGDEIAESLIQVLTDKEFSHALGRNEREMVERDFRVEMVGEKIIKALEGLTA